MKAQLNIKTLKTVIANFNRILKLDKTYSLNTDTVHIEAFVSGLVILSYVGRDYELRHEIQDAGVFEVGSTSLPITYLHKICSKIKGDILLTIEDEKPVFYSGKRKLTPKLSPTDVDYSLSHFIGDGFVVNPNIIQSLKTLSKYASSDDSRPNLMYVNGAENEDGSVSLTATDGHRLTTFRNENFVSQGDFKEFFFPAALSKAVLPLFKGGDSVRIVHHKKDGYEDPVSLSNGRTTVVWHVAPMKFPDYKQVIPRIFESAVKVDKATLKETLTIAGSFTNPKTMNVKFRVNKDEESFTISASNEDLGDFEENIGEECVEILCNVACGFNYKYMLEVLSDVQGDKIELAIIDTLSPMLVHGDDEDQLFVVMPMRL